MMRILLFSVFNLAIAAPANKYPRDASPTVVIPAPRATVTGKSVYEVESFRGIPFAQAPIGNLRLKPPRPFTSPLGSVDGTGTPQACPQYTNNLDPTDFPEEARQTLTNIGIFANFTDYGEDCLTIDVQRPERTAGLATSRLPVLFWIYGGGFQIGSTQFYDGTALIRESVAQGKPIIVVSVNYRVGAFGFLAGKELLADGSTNLGLLDQRLGMKWVSDNIAAFGGDPNKVTIWGESAGSASVMSHLLMSNGDHRYKGRPLFRAAIMNSGSIVPAERADSQRAQKVYDTVVREAGCSRARNTLACLRSIDYPTFHKASNSVPGVLSYNNVALSYLPRPDGILLSDSPERLVKAGRYAKVPFIVGDQEDEGTLFALFTPNLTTKSEVSKYFNTVFFPQVDRGIIDDLVDTYGTSDGSPYRTGQLNNWYPQYKRVAAIIGDYTFTLTRRVLLEISSTLQPNVPVWSYLGTYYYGVPILGSFHGSDLLQLFYTILPGSPGQTIAGYYFSFVYDLNPNSDNDLEDWPQWKDGRQIAWFDATTTTMIADDFRSSSYEIIKENIDRLRT